MYIFLYKNHLNLLILIVYVIKKIQNNLNTPIDRCCIISNAAVLKLCFADLKQSIKVPPFDFFFFSKLFRMQEESFE